MVYLQECLDRLRNFDKEGSGNIELSTMKKFLQKVHANLTDTALLQVLLMSGSCNVDYEKLLSWIFNQEVAAKTLALSGCPGHLAEELPAKEPVAATSSTGNDEKHHELILQCISGWKKCTGEPDPDPDLKCDNKSVPLSKVDWRCGTWNAAGELSKFEFLPLQGDFANALERLMGAVVRKLAGYKTKSWARYKPDASGWPRKEDVDFLTNLTVQSLLEDFDVEALCTKWGKWSDENTSGKECMQKHLSNWYSVSLKKFFHVALDNDLSHQENDRNMSKIPGLKEHMAALISNPDSWFSERMYHIRGDQWTDFVKDATKTGFTSKDFWQKWIKGLSETYKWDASKPIQFEPSDTDFDYVAPALWDRYIFLAVNRVAMAGFAPKDDGDIKLLEAQVDIPKEKALESMTSKLGWVTGTARVDVLCLQEAGSFVPPENWRCFPNTGASTVVWVANDKVEEELTKEAERNLAELRKVFLEVGTAWKALQESMNSEVKGAIDRTMEGGLEKLQIPSALKKFLADIVQETHKDLAEALEENLHSSQHAKQFRKIQRWFSEDKLAVVVARLGGEPCLVLSAHGESGGHTSRQVLLLAKSLHDRMSYKTPGLKMVVGMDANVKTTNTGLAASPESLLETANDLGFACCTMGTNRPLKCAGRSEDVAKHTVLKTRSFLQPQLKGKAGVPDENMKDYIFYLRPKERKYLHRFQGRAINQMVDNNPEGLYVPGGMPRGLDFPSDHALVIVESEMYQEVPERQWGPIT